MERLDLTWTSTKHSGLILFTPNVLGKIIKKEEKRAWERTHLTNGTVGGHPKTPGYVCYHCQHHIIVWTVALSKARSGGKKYYHKTCAEQIHLI